MKTITCEKCEGSGWLEIRCDACVGGRPKPWWQNIPPRVWVGLVFVALLVGFTFGVWFGGKQTREICRLAAAQQSEQCSAAIQELILPTHVDNMNVFNADNWDVICGTAEVKQAELEGVPIEHPGSSEPIPVHGFTPDAEPKGTTP
jgi:hypothetical protein